MRKIKLISLIMLLSIVVLLPKSNAALISKPGGGVLVNTTVSNSYLLCQGMKDLGESLYGAGSNVEPHLATNKDWGAVSYLSNSVYGTNTKGGNNGVTVTINGTSYYSTNGNTSGVMNWGYNPNKGMYSQTSALLKAYMDLADTTTSTAHDNVTELEKAARSNSKYVDIIDTNTTGMAITEISLGSPRYNGNKPNQPIVIRRGLFGYVKGYPFQYVGDTEGDTYVDVSGRERPYITFRPVVWN